MYDYVTFGSFAHPSLLPYVPTLYGSILVLINTTFAPCIGLGSVIPGFVMYNMCILESERRCHIHVNIGASTFVQHL